METKDSDYPDASIFKCLFMLKICFSPATLSLHITFTVSLTYTSEPPPSQKPNLAGVFWDHQECWDQNLEDWV